MQHGDGVTCAWTWSYVYDDQCGAHTIWKCGPITHDMYMSTRLHTHNYVRWGWGWGGCGGGGHLERKVEVLARDRARRDANGINVHPPLVDSEPI